MISPENAEILGAIIGDKGTVKRTRRYGWYNGYDLSKYHRYVVSICLGKDVEWGHHLSSLMLRSFGLHGSTCRDGDNWRFVSNSTKVFREMTKYYKSEWNAKTWRICREIFESSFRVKESLLRGYFDADGYPYYNKARQQVLVQVNSVNNRGLLDTKGLLLSLNYHPGLYRRYKTKDVWELTIHRNAEVIRFHDEIGFSIGRKQSRLETILERRQLIR